MRKDEVILRELFAQLLDGLQKRVVIRHKNLNVIAQVHEFPQRTDKIWNRTRRSIPNEDGKFFAPEMCGDCATDNPETDHANVCVLWLGRRRGTLHEIGSSAISVQTKMLPRNPEISQLHCFKPNSAR